MAILIVLLLLATFHERHAAELQFNWTPKPRIDDSDKAGGDEILNGLLVVYGPVAPTVPILALAHRAGVARQELDAPWLLARLPSLRAPPGALSLPIV